MGPVSLDVVGQTVPVASLVDEFNKLSEPKSSQCEKGLMLECENEIKGIVKKVVKFFNEFAERQIQSKSKKQVKLRQRKLKERLRKKDEANTKQVVNQPVPTEYLDPAQV